MVQRNKDFTLKFNADQADAGLIDLDSGKLKLFMNANVDTLAFDDASGFLGVQVNLKLMD